MIPRFASRAGREKGKALAAVDIYVVGGRRERELRATSSANLFGGEKGEEKRREGSLSRSWKKSPGERKGGGKEFFCWGGKGGKERRTTGKGLDCGLSRMKERKGGTAGCPTHDLVGKEGRRRGRGPDPIIAPQIKKKGKRREVLFVSSTKKEGGALVAENEEGGEGGNLLSS